MSGDKSPRKKAWQVYIVRCIDETLYTGIAKNIESRLLQHNAGKASKYTRARRPVRLVYTESMKRHGDALRREKEIKHLNRKEKVKLILNPVGRS